MQRPDASDREAWHSEHYRADDGLPFRKAIIDALTANPDGLSVVGVRDWLHDTEHFLLTSTYSWLRSFGHEQSQLTPGPLAGRSTRKNEDVRDRYNGWPSDSQPDAQVEYALTERLDWWIKRMRETKQVQSMGLDNVRIDSILHVINGRRNAGVGVYVTGEKPLRVPGQVERHDSKGRLITRPGLVDYQPLAIDWGQREMVWRKHLEEALARKTSRPGELRGLLMEADRIFTRQDDRWPA